MVETKQANVTAEAERVEDDAPVAETVDYIEYLGEEPHGVDFLTSFTLPRGDALWKRNKLNVTKEVTWERDPLGPGIGQKGSRMLVRVDDLPTGAAAVLEKTPGFKRVSE
jgi:hypothetical protein